VSRQTSHVRGGIVRGMKRRVPALGAVVALAAMSLSGVAVADDISNALDPTVDAVAEVMPLNAGGIDGTTQLYLVERNGDGKNGCNLTGSTTLTVAVSSSDASVATVSPSSATFTSCGDTKALTVTPLAPGSTTISVAQTSNDTAGTFDLTPATFTVNVAGPANTAPTVLVGGVTGGANYGKGSVPAATCDVTDAEDGDSSFAAQLSPVTGAWASDGIGSQTASCSYTDGGGLTASASMTYDIIDPSAPVIDYTVTPATPNGQDGWYNSGAVTLTWLVEDPESPNSVQKTGCVDQNIAADQGATTYPCSVTSAGGTSLETSVEIKRDATAPTVSYTAATGTEGSNGWYTSDVTVEFTAADALSGPLTASATVTSSGEGAAVTVASPAFSDVAGNTTPAGAAVSPAFKIDKSAPTNIGFVGGPSSDSSHYFGSVPAAPTCIADDAVSGVASCIVTGYSLAVGLHTLSATATDNAGNVHTLNRSYTVLGWTPSGFYQPVDMNGVLNTVKGGSTVPLKFEISAGLTELTNTSAISSFAVREISCSLGTAMDDIETTTTGGTSLRYDSTAGQFVQNWQTPRTPGKCYVVTMTAQDGSALVAHFKTK
jgi:hypothetical protein